MALPTFLFLSVSVTVGISALFHLLKKYSIVRELNIDATIHCWKYVTVCTVGQISSEPPFQGLLSVVRAL